MKRALALASLPALFVLALAAVELPLVRARAAPPASLMADAESAWHARRVTLGLASARFPQEDRLLAHPDATAFADPPAFDALLAFSARALLGANAGGPSEGPPDEAALERLLAQVGPALLIALLAGLALAARGRGPGGAARATLAVALVALSPQAFDVCAAGRVEVAALAAVLLVFQLRLARAAWASDDALDRLQGALLAGLVTGVGLASTPLFAGAALGAWGGFLVDAWSAEGRAARDRARAGLLFSVAAVLPAHLPAMDGPWRAAQEGPVAEWAGLASAFLVVGCAAFALPLLVARCARFATPRAARLVACATAMALVALVLFAPAGEGVARPLRAALRVHLLPGAPGVGALWSSLAAPAALASLALWSGATLALARPLRAALNAPERCCFALTLGLGGLAAAVHAPAGLLFLAPAAAGIAAALDPALRPARAGVALVACASVLGLSRTVRAAAFELRDERALVALRWLRANSPASGAWFAAGAGHDYGVLAEPELAGLVPYHARRPAFASDARSCADPGAQARAQRALAAPTLEALLAEMDALGARYLAVRAGGALAALVASEPVSGLERVWPPGGAPASGEVAILRRADAARERPARPYFSR